MIRVRLLSDAMLRGASVRKGETLDAPHGIAQRWINLGIADTEARAHDPLEVAHINRVGSAKK